MKRTKNFADVIRAKLAADPRLADNVKQAAFNSDVAQKVRELRAASGLTQKQLAQKVGTSQSVISRIEDDDYDGHSLGLLRRIADAVDKLLRVEFYSQIEQHDAEVREFSVKWTCRAWNVLGQDPDAQVATPPGVPEVGGVWGRFTGIRGTAIANIT